MAERLDRRNPGRGDGFKWNADSFICSDQIDGDHGFGNREHDVNEFETECHYDERTPSSTISFADMIRMAKPKKGTL
jgi:hypothetical protein